jgi:hypothetical protein
MQKRAGLAKTAMASREVLIGPGVATLGVDFPRLTRSGFELSTPEQSRRSAIPATCSKVGLARSDGEATGTRQDKRFTMRMLLIALCAVMAVLPVTLAVAEETKAPVQAAAPIETSVPKLDCSRPQLPQQLPTVAAEAGSLTKQVGAYAACVTRYVNERRAQAQKHGDLAKEEADAGNAAAKDINEFFASAKQLLQKGKEKAAN